MGGFRAAGSGGGEMGFRAGVVEADSGGEVEVGDLRPEASEASSSAALLAGAPGECSAHRAAGGSRKMREAQQAADVVTGLSANEPVVLSMSQR